MLAGVNNFSTLELLQMLALIPHRVFKEGSFHTEK